MIPKIIHYCWLSDDAYPEKIKRCIDTWNKVAPDYEIWLWNFNRLGDAVNDWVREAYANKKYAFAADFIRAYALYNHGGIYLDSDVELLKSFDAFLHLPYFFCQETGGDNVEAACMGAEKGNPVFQKLLQYYDGRHFVKSDGTLDTYALPKIISGIIDENFTVRRISEISDFNASDTAVINMFPGDYFSPIHAVTSELIVTDRTVAIHHYAASWCSPYLRFKKRLQRLIGARMTLMIINVKRKLKQWCK